MGMRIRLFYIFILFWYAILSNCNTSFSQSFSKDDWNNLFEYSKDWIDIIKYKDNKENHELWFSFDNDTYDETYNVFKTYEIILLTIEVVFGYGDKNGHPEELIKDGFYIFERQNYIAKVPYKYFRDGVFMVGWTCSDCYDSDLESIKQLYSYKKKL